MLLLTWGLLAMSLIDADHQLLPDVLVLPLLWLGLIANHFGLFASLDDALFGAVFGYLSLWSVFWLFKLVTGKEAWATATSSCWPCSVPGAAGRSCR